MSVWELLRRSLEALRARLRLPARAESAVLVELVLLLTVMPALAEGPRAAGAFAAPVVPGRPLSLTECTVIALENNPQIGSAEQGVISARAGVTRARSSYYPQLSFQAVEGFAGSASSLFPDGGTNRRDEAGLVLGQTLWRRGRKESIARSEASLRASEFGRASTVQSLVGLVARDYYALLAASQLVGVAEAGVTSSEGHLEQVKARIKFGDAAAVEVYPAEDDLARARLDLIDARSNVRLAQARLKNTMGVPPSVEVQLAESPPAAAGETPTLAEALEVALARRPEVLASQASTSAAGSALRLARINRGPIADISGQYARNYTEWRLRERTWDVLLNFAFPIFDGYARRADVTAAEAGLGLAQADYQQTVNQVGLEVENALVEVERSRERVTASAASVAAAEARLAAAEGKYRQGIGILIEVIDARVAVTNARASQVRARYDYQTALVGVQRARGMLAVPQTTDSLALR